jgi:hypothetical protein
MPVEPGNKAIEDGSLPKIMQSFIDEQRPEASYFYAENGKRTGLFVFDLKDPAHIPCIVEPLFQHLHAAIELYPVMNAQAMKAGVEKAARSSGRVLVSA